MTKVLIFHAALAPYRVDLFNELHKELDLRIVFFAHQVPYHLELDQEVLCRRLLCGHEYLSRGTHLAGRDFRAGIWRAIDKHKPDVVVTSEFSYATLATLFCRGFPTYGRFRHVIWTADNVAMLHEMGRLRSGLRSVCSRLSDAVLIYSQPVKDVFQKQFAVPEEKVFVCASHQNEKAFAQRCRSARKLAAAHVRRQGLGGKRILLFVGRLVQIKNLERALKAFAVVVRTHTNAMLVFVRDGPERVRLQDKARRLGLANHTLFAGHQEGDDLFVWYLLASASLLTSISETYGAVVNESPLAGVPVLCSQRAGAGVLIHEDRNGYLFNPYDVEHLTTVMRRMLGQSTTADAVGGIERSSLMPVPFERDVNGFVEAISYAAGISKRAQKLVAATCASAGRRMRASYSRKPSQYFSRIK